MSGGTAKTCVVVGAGTAGSILTRRLLDAGHEMILVETGSTDRNPAIHLVSRLAELWHSPARGRHERVTAPGEVPEDRSDPLPEHRKPAYGEAAGKGAAEDEPTPREQSTTRRRTMGTRSRHTTRTTTAAGVLAVAVLGIAGCGADEADTGTDVEDITEGEVIETPVPGATETVVAPAPAPVGSPYVGPYNRQFFDDQLTYEGQEVTLTAEIEEIVSPQALEISDPNDIELDPLLVIHDLDQPDLEEDQVVEVIGTVQASFDQTVVEQDLGIDLDDEMFADYAGEPYVQATEVNTDVPAQ